MRQLTKIPLRVLGGLWIVCLVFFFLVSTFTKPVYSVLFSELSNLDFDRVEKILNVKMIKYQTEVATNSIFINKEIKDKIQNEIILEEEFLSARKLLTYRALSQSNISKNLTLKIQEQRLAKSLSLMFGSAKVFSRPFVGLKKVLNPEVVLVLEQKKLSVSDLNKVSKLLSVVDFGIKDPSKILIFSKKGSLLYDFYQKPRRNSVKELFRALSEIDKSNLLLSMYWEKELGKNSFLVESKYEAKKGQHLKAVLINGGIAHGDSENFDSEYKDLSVLILDKKMKDELGLKAIVSVEEKIFTGNDLKVLDEVLNKGESQSALFSFLSPFKDFLQYFSIFILLCMAIKLVQTNKYFREWPFDQFGSEKVKNIFSNESNLLCAAIMKQMNFLSKIRLRYLLGRSRYNEIQKSSKVIGGISQEVHQQSIKYINSKY